jgi:hypothetical protein
VVAEVWDPAVLIDHEPGDLRPSASELVERMLLDGAHRHEPSWGDWALVEPRVSTMLEAQLEAFAQLVMAEPEALGPDEQRPAALHLPLPRATCERRAAR